MNSCPKPLPHLPQLTYHHSNNNRTWVCGCSCQQFWHSIALPKGKHNAWLWMNGSGFQPCQGTSCVVFLGKTLYSQIAFVFSGVQMGTGNFNAGSKPCNGLASHSGWSRLGVLLDSSCYRNRDKLQPDGPLGSYADFTHLKVLLSPWCSMYISSPKKWPGPRQMYCLWGQFWLLGLATCMKAFSVENLAFLLTLC